MKKYLIVLSILFLTSISNAHELRIPLPEFKKFGYGIGIIQESKKNYLDLCFATHYFFDGKIKVLNSETNIGLFTSFQFNKKVTGLQPLGVGILIGFPNRTIDNKKTLPINIGIGYKESNFIFITTYRF